MAPLSKELSGLIIFHDQFGSHLDASGRTISKDLERQNFDFAGKVLAEVWDNLVLDKYPVIAKYIAPETDQDLNLWTPTHARYIKHVQESQYFYRYAFQLIFFRKISN